MSVARHRQGAVRGDPYPWGWKQPRSVHLLPALEAAYPGELQVLHVIRDGRDAALGNDIHLRLTGSYSVPPELRNEPTPIQLAHLWATANNLVADFGEQVLGERYLRVSLDELCDDVDGVTSRMLAFMGGDISSDRRREIVQRPESIGRWHGADPEVVAQVVGHCGDALRRFGYEP